jgi:Na+-transporting methylmalonyl-CoA/oxaloacetate decarboxylase beta subunit
VAEEVVTASAEEVEATASAGVSIAVSLATGSAGRADFLVVDTMAVVTMGVVTMGVVTMGAVFATLMEAFSALDIRAITRFIIPTITRILSTGLIWDTNVFRESSQMPSPPG